jgi:hypothetical protein
MAVAKLDLFDQVFTNDGDPGAGYKIDSYQGGTTTPLATYTDSTGLIANANPIVADSAGRFEVWITVDTAYKFALKTDGDVTLETVDNVRIDSGAGTASTRFDVVLTYPGGPPGATEWLGGERLRTAVDFPANWSGSYGKAPLTNPAASFVVTVKRSGSTIGTWTCSTAGVWTPATSGGAAFSFAAGDYIDFYAPATPDTNIEDFGLTLAGTVAA